MANSQVLLIGGETFAASLKQVTADGEFTFAAKSGDRSISRDLFVRWGHPIAAGEGRAVLLGDGTVLILPMPWDPAAARRSLQIDDQSLSIAPTSLRPLQISRTEIRAVVYNLRGPVLKRDRLLARAAAHDFGEDVVLLARNDQLKGRVTTLAGDDVAINTSLGIVSLKADQIAAVLFDAQLAPRKPADKEAMLVGLADGTRLVAKSLVIENGQLQATLVCGALAQCDIGAVVHLQSLGKAIDYLSDMSPLRFVHVPYLSIESPFVEDHNVQGGRLQVNKQMYAKGLGMHSAARLVYRLDGNSARFATSVGIDDAAGGKGSAVFRVLLADAKGWKLAYSSSTLRGGDPSEPISVELNGALGIALVVDYADDGDELDYANWLDARLEE